MKTLIKNRLAIAVVLVLVLTALLVAAGYFLGVVCRQIGKSYELMLSPSMELLSLFLRFLLALGAVAVAAGLVAALLGWLESSERFNLRKFGGSIIRALIAGIIFAVGYQLSEPLGILDLFYAFLGGAGVDVIGNRIAGKFGNGSFPLPKPPGGES